METTEMPELLRRGSMDDGDSEAAALRAISDDESLTAEASNKEISLKKNAFEQKCGINVIVHADDNNSDSDMSASNFSPHSEVVNGVSELSKDGISEEETKDTHFNVEPRNGMNKDEDSIDDFGDVGSEFSSQDFVPKTLGLKDEISESEGGGGGYTALKNTVSEGTSDNGLNEDSSNPKTIVIQDFGEANEHENVEKICSGEVSKSEFDNYDVDCAGVDENNDWQGSSTTEKTSKLSIVEDYLSDENSSDKEVSKVFSDDESGGGKLADRQFKEIYSETSSEAETAKGNAPTDAKFKEIETDILSEDEEGMLEGKELKEIPEDNSSDDETAVRESLGDEFYGTEKCNASSEYHKDEISEDESIKSNLGEGIKEDSLERKTVVYDDIQRSSAEECEKTDASDDESDGDSSECSSPQEDDSSNFDDHFKHSRDGHISSSDSESFDKGSMGDSEEKTSYSHDLKHKKPECCLSPDRHEYKDARKDEDENFSEYSFDDKVMSSKSEGVKSHKYVSQDRSFEGNVVDTEKTTDVGEITELRAFQASLAAENEDSDLPSTDNTREEIKAHEGSTFPSDTEKKDGSYSAENEGNDNDVDVPLYNKDLNCEISEEGSLETAPSISQEPNTSYVTELHGESALESNAKEEAQVLNEERNIGTQSCENVCDSAFIGKLENVVDTCQVSCEEKSLQQEDEAIKLGDFSCLSKDNFLEHEDNRSSSDSEGNDSLGKGTDGNRDTCLLNVSDDDRNTNSPCQILQDKEQEELDVESVNLSTVPEGNQSDNGNSSQVKVDSIKNVMQKDDDDGPLSSDNESMTNESHVRDFVSLDDICEPETSVDINEGKHERKAEAGIIENDDNVFKPQKETEIDAVQKHPDECGMTQSLLCVDNNESDARSRETTTGVVDFEETINDAQSDLQMELLTDKERVSVGDNVDVSSGEHRILPTSHLAVSELKDKADVGEIDSACSAGHVSSDKGESKADKSVISLLESDNPENGSADNTGLITCETDQSEAVKLNRSLSGSDASEDVSEVVPANTNERSLEQFDLVKSNTPNHHETDDTVIDRKFSLDDPKLVDSKKGEEKEEGKEEEGGEKEEEEEDGGGEEKEEVEEEKEEVEEEKEEVEEEKEEVEEEKEEVEEEKEEVVEEKEEVEEEKEEVEKEKEEVEKEKEEVEKEEVEVEKEEVEVEKEEVEEVEEEKEEVEEEKEEVEEEKEEVEEEEEEEMEEAKEKVEEGEAGEDEGKEKVEVGGGEDEGKEKVVVGGREEEVKEKMEEGGVEEGKEKVEEGGVEEGKEKVEGGRVEEGNEKVEEVEGGGVEGGKEIVERGGGVEEEKEIVEGGGGVEEEKDKVEGGRGGVEEEKEEVEGGRGGVEEEKEEVEGGRGGVEEEKEGVEGGGGVEEEKEKVEGGRGVEEEKEKVEGGGGEEEEEKEKLEEGGGGEEKEELEGGGGGGEEEEEEEKAKVRGGEEKEEEEAAAATAAAEEGKEKTHKEAEIFTTHQECESASNSSSQNSVQELGQKDSSPDTSKGNLSYVETLPCTEIPKDSADEASQLKVELNEEECTNVNENVIGQISLDTNSVTEESENIDIHQNCSKEEKLDHIDEISSVNSGNGIETSTDNVASEHSTGAPVISDDGIQSENTETSTKIELSLTNGTDYRQTLEDVAMDTDDLKDRLVEERKSNQGNRVNDVQSEHIVKKASMLENSTANDSVSQGEQVNDSRKRKLSSSPEDEPVSKEGCSLQFKGFKKRILAQASLDVADEQMHHQHQTLPKPEELQPDLADSYTTPLTEYAQYLGLQPIVKFKCYLCGETGFPSIFLLQQHQSSCLKTSKTRPVSQQPVVPDTVTVEGEGVEGVGGDCPAVGTAVAVGPTDVSGTPSTNFRITRKVYLCSVCGTYYENWNLFLHMKEMHRRFICLFCLTMFTDAGMLATHLSDEHSVTDRLYDTQEGFRAEIADEACFLVCCDCERIFAHTDNFYEHVCPTPPTVEKHLMQQQPQQEPKQLQKHRRQQQKQKQVEQSNQHIQGVCSLCGLRGAHFPTCRRASSNSNALTTLVDGSGAVTELSPPEGEHQSEKQPVAKTDVIKKRSAKGKITTKTLPSGDIDAEIDGDEDYDISHAASFCQINIHETPADKTKASDQSASSTPVTKVTLKTKNIPATVLSNNSATNKNFVSVVKQEPDTPDDHELDVIPSAVLESQKPKKTTESTTVTGIKSVKRGASCSPVPATEGKKPKFDQLKEHVDESVEDIEGCREQTSSPVPESDSLSSHSQDSDRLHINTQESESVDGQSCADEDDAAAKDAGKDPEATDVDKTEDTTPEKQLTPASTKAQHPRDRGSESESESSGSANDIPSHKTEDSSSSSEAEAEAVSSSEDRKQDAPPEAAAEQKSEDISDDGGGTAEEPESGGEESSKDSPALVVDEEATDDNKDNLSGSNQPTTIGEGGEIQVAGDDVPALELTLEEQPEVMTLQALVKECVRVSCNSCVFCNHAKKIAVNGSQLALHLLAEHRFEPVVCTDTADLKPVPADGFTARLKEAVHNLREAFFNTDSYDSTADPSDASTADRGENSHIYDRSYECFHCHFNTTLHKELYIHNRKMHQKTILLCVMCKSNFYSYSELLCHICPGLYAPDADISFRCCLCSVDKLPSAFRLMVHLRKRHHACDVCLEATGDQQRLSNHVWKHKLHHLCYRCGIAYRNKPDITKHLFWKHGTESVLCKKCLQKKWPHVYHFCIPPTAFNCEECGASFARAVALKVHRRLHSGDRPYTCEDCPDSFISRKLLARHWRLKHAPPEPSPPPPSSLEQNATAQRDREYPGALDTEASSVRDSDTDQNKSDLENKLSVSLDNKPDNQMSGDGEKPSDDAVKKNKVMDVYDLPPLNLSSDSDDSDEPDTKDSKTVTSPAAVSAPEVKDSETEVKPEPSVSDNVVGEEEEPAPVQIIDGVWDNFKNYKASLERKEQEAAGVATGSYSTSLAIEVIMSDHDYCVVSKPRTDDGGSGEGASRDGAEGPDVSDKAVEGDKDSGSNTDSSPETMEATDDGNRSQVVASDSVPSVSSNAGGLRVSAGSEKTSDKGRAPVVATEAAPSVPSGTPPQPSNISTTTSSKKRTKQARKRQKREGASSSSSSSSSDSDSSSCSCGTNCSCSSSSSSSSGSSSSSSDSDSSTSEGRRRQAARRERRRERARKKATAPAAVTVDTVPASSGEAAVEPMSRTPTASSVPVTPCDTERERADGVILESDLETDETETDEDFYDQYPQRQANRLLAEKRNRLMLLAAVAPASNETAQLAQQLQELNQQQHQQHQEQQQLQRHEEPQLQREEDRQQAQPLPLQQTLQQIQPHHVRVRSGAMSGDSRKVRTRKRKRAVPSDVRIGSAPLAGSAETAVRPLGSLPMTTYRDSSGVVTQPPIPESTSVPSATSAVRTTGGSGSEGESKRLSKRRRVPKRFYGDSSDEDGEAPVTPQPKWRKTGSGGGGGIGGATATASVVSSGAPAIPSHAPEPPHLPIRQQVTLPSAAALLSSARSVAAGRRPVETVGHSTSSSSSSSSGSDDADSNYESASDGGGGGGARSGGGGVSGGSSVGVGSLSGVRTGGTAGAEVDNAGNKSENLYCYCQCPYDEVSEMIACDGKDCQIEWFHFECVGIMVPPKGKWFCPDCRKKSSASRGGEYLLHA